MRHFKTYLELGAVEPEDAFQCQLGGGAVGDHPLLHLRGVLAGQDIHLTARPLHVGPGVAKALDRVLARPAHCMQSSAPRPPRRSACWAAVGSHSPHLEPLSDPVIDCLPQQGHAPGDGRLPAGLRGTRGLLGTERE